MRGLVVLCSALAGCLPAVDRPPSDRAGDGQTDLLPPGDADQDEESDTDEDTDTDPVSLSPYVALDVALVGAVPAGCNAFQGPAGHSMMFFADGDGARLAFSSTDNLSDLLGGGPVALERTLGGPTAELIVEELVGSDRFNFECDEMVFAWAWPACDSRVYRATSGTVHFDIVPEDPSVYDHEVLMTEVRFSGLEFTEMSAPDSAPASTSDDTCDDRPFDPLATAWRPVDQVFANVAANTEVPE